MVIKHAGPGIIDGIASLHKTELRSGFLSKLDKAVLSYLYQFIMQEGILLVAFTHEETLAGFVSFSINTGKMMNKFIRASVRIYFQLIFIYLKHPGYLIRSLETLLIPFKTNRNKETKKLPDGELLSIVVNPAIQNTGTGHALLEKLEEELKIRKIYCYKVIAGEQLVSANRFYQKNGFILAQTIRIHGGAISNVYVKELPHG